MATIALRPVFFFVGVALTILAAAMVLPAAVDATHHDADWRIFAACAAVTAFVGLALALGGRDDWRRPLTIRQIFLLTAGGWTAVTLAAALPFATGMGLHLSVTDAVFEAVSGTTASGATVVRGLARVAPGILMWRALLQWLGGIGFLILAVIALPVLNIGGMQLYRLESGATTDRVMPRAARIVAALIALYVAFTILLTALLWVAGMSRFPALLHAMTTISCGGFSTSDGSVGSWHRAGIDWIILAGMVIAGAPFVVYLQLLQRRWRQASGDRQLSWYFGMFLAATAALALWLWFAQGMKPLPALRHGAFAAASVMTGTGFATLDYTKWQGFPVAILFFLTFVGGCAGSVAGGIKVFRVRILLDTVRLQFIRLLRPHAVLQAIPDPVAESVLGYLFVYAMAFAAVALGLSALGLDFFSAISASAAALANLGPGLSPATGPLAGYAALPDAAKWLLSAAMLFGRLEMFTILVLFTSAFWEP